MTQRRLPPLLRRAWYSLNQAFRQRISPLGITPDQFSILRWLHEGPSTGLTQSDLTRSMASDPNTATVRRMESAGLLKRSLHQEDRRARLVTLQPAGQRVFEAAQEVASELQNRILSNLSPEEVDPFLRLLEKVARACAEQVDLPPAPSKPKRG
jgi:DNA-binding MarR family transcriptional regulator